jgi:hypothetical protein
MRFDKNYIKSNVKATLKIEGKQASPEAIEINDQFLDGNIDSKTAIEAIKNLYNIETKVKKTRCKV